MILYLSSHYNISVESFPVASKVCASMRKSVQLTTTTNIVETHTALTSHSSSTFKSIFLKVIKYTNTHTHPLLSKIAFHQPINPHFSLLHILESAIFCNVYPRKEKDNKLVSSTDVLEMEKFVAKIAKNATFLVAQKIIDAMKGIEEDF